MSSKPYFDAVGANWDRMRERFFSDRLRERAIEIADVERDRWAADLGAGTGFIAGALIERGLHVIAVDQSEAMLAALRDKYPQADRLDCRLGDAGALPIADAAVTYCFANMFLHHVERPAEAIREMARIVEPGGRVVVTDLGPHRHEFLRTEHHDRWMGFAREEVERWFREAGFVEVRVEPLEESCCTESKEGEPASIGIFAACGTRPTWTSSRAGQR